MSILDSVENNLETIQKNIRDVCENVGRSPEEINIIAVTKYVSADRAKEAVKAGVHHLGENRDDGLLEKWEVLSNKATWHFIGTLQSKKVKKIIDKVEYIHSLDRESLAEEIHKRTEKTVKCFIQVNVSGEDSKHGLPKEEALAFVRKLEKYTSIQVVGLMTMAPYTDDEAEIRNCFRELKTLQGHIQEMNLPYAPCKELSMGMSNDYRIAIEEGATFIRIGSALVGNEQ
ncbi:YggS family pyridoxal phosphate-dependent enzyme [Sutcliffiella horikoshii]|uniref:YggS family pyridoxal phosphate-dependent enzyme n=1 Tax=Sutcliffiella horikoshii TaxID=79883 RepID=UPI001EEEC764|nr:YggS family pyridoxal phosphate-dependent enzyme [Sutcliffiella horikoshii]MCG1020567.1 YggS family pyridoxal phosphate-dependent enzyme [Sutcliffiella horikoshii]